MKRCNLCPRRCNIDRSQAPGACSVGNELLIGSIVIHRGEEPPLIKGTGSGAIFFCGCPLKCSYCQNRQISHLVYGQVLSTARLASYMVELQHKGCSNINLVTSSHYTPLILESIDIARDSGLLLPIVFNSGGYESITTLELWKDHGDIYLMDLKYGDNAIGRALSNVGDYWDRAREAIAYLWDIIGPLRTDHSGRGLTGLIVRHLVLPGMLSNPFSVLEFLAGLSPDIPLSIMSQYNPVFYKDDVHQLKRSLLEEEYAVVLERAIEMGFTTIFSQDMDAPQTYVPDFQGESPFGDYQKLI